jgi:hypothetical protein
MHIFKKICLKTFLFLSIFFSISLNTFVEKLFYTTIEITDQRVLTLINSQAFQRLYNIAQYGIDPVVLPDRQHTKVYNRANHSLGVYWLLNRYNAPFEEQIAGLGHDLSHTTHSHVGDKIFKHKDGKSSYQDDHHLEFLSETDLPEIFKSLNIPFQVLDHKNPAYTCLEDDLPNGCADRIEYNLAGGVLEKLITPEEAMAILDHLKFESNRWYFTDVYHAKKFASISLWHTEFVWGSQMSNYVSEELAQAIRYAYEHDILSLDDIKHGTDDLVWNRLCSCNNAQVNIHVQKILDAHNHQDEINATPRNNKFRGINPWVQVGDTFKRLTEVDQDFKNEYERVKAGSY